MPKVRGIIRLPKDNRGKVKHIYVNNGKKEVRITYDKFLWVKDGDKIIAKYDKDSWECTEHPLVVINMDVTKIIEEFKYNFNFSENKATDLVEHIRDKFDCDYKEVGNVLCILSDEYTLNRYISSRLLSFGGISRTSWSIFFKNWYKNYSLRRIFNHNFSYFDIERTMMKPSEIYKCLENNPLAIIGIPFEKAKSLCKLIGIEITSDMIKYHSYMLQVFEKLDKFKWMSIMNGEMIPFKKQLLKYNVIYDDDYSRFYLKPVYEMETKLVSMIVSLVKGNKKINITHNDPNIEGNQLQAVNEALSNNVFIIGGSAGTGKSTIIKYIVDALKKHKYQFILTSFTGMATNVLRQKTGSPAYTFHSLFLNNRVDLDKYKKNGKLHIIIDEFSTIYLQLLYRLLSMYKFLLGDMPTITFVGDINQTIPIKFGNPFLEMLKSETIPRIFLNKNYRLKNSGSEVNSIMINSECICRNIQIPGDFYTDSRFKMIESTDETKVIKLIANNFRDKDIKRFIILCAYVKDTEILNKEIQKLFNIGAKKKVDSGGNLWLVGDRVVVTKNNSHHDIANGQRGIILDIKKEQIHVKLDDKEGVYCFNITGKIVKGERNDENDDEVSSETLYSHNLKLGYAITINKSQGTQCEIVIGFISKSVCTSFLNKNLLYTLITRAETMVMLVGNKSVYSEMKYRERSKTIEFMGERLASKLDKVEETIQEPNDDFEKAMALAGLDYSNASMTYSDDFIFYDYDY